MVEEIPWGSIIQQLVLSGIGAGDSLQAVQEGTEPVSKRTRFHSHDGGDEY